MAKVSVYLVECDLEESKFGGRYSRHRSQYFFNLEEANAYCDSLMLEFFNDVKFYRIKKNDFDRVSFQVEELIFSDDDVESFDRYSLKDLSDHFDLGDPFSSDVIRCIVFNESYFIDLIDFLRSI